MADTLTNTDVPPLQAAAQQVKDQASQIKDQAQQAIQQGKDQVDHLKDQVKQQAEPLKGQAQQAVQQGQTLASNALKAGQSQFHTLLTVQKNKAATAVTEIADVLRESGTQLQGKGQTGGAQIANRVADRITSLGNMVQEKEVEEWITDTETFARTRPALFLSIATLLGFLLVRFLRSSNQNA